MLNRHWFIGGVVLLLVCLATAAVTLADKLTLKDGTVLEGTIIKQTDRYWVKTADGESRIVPAGDVESFTRTSSAGHSAGHSAGSTPAGSAPAEHSGAPVMAGPSLASVERKAENVEVASAAVKIWQDYIASNPRSPDDLKRAKEQLARWTQMVNDGAERINGKWIVGEEHKKMVDSAAALFKEAIALLQKNETLKGVKKLEESQRVYPNSFVVNFLLGYMAFSQDNMDKALPFFESAAKLRPNSAEAAANLGLVYFKKQQYEKGILQIQRAAEMADTIEIAYNLNVLVNTAPESVKSSRRIKPAIDAANLLASKYAMPPGIWKRGIKPIPLHENQRGQEGEPPPGAVASGTGFIISSDGLILTNRHVVKGGKTFQVILQGGAKLTVETVKIDEEQDLALVRVKTAKPLATVKFADRDAPGDGAECTVIGFPLGDRYTSAPKVTHGIVTSSKVSTEGADVMVDAKVNPGNSGGPILDKSGHVMAIVCMKSLSSQTEDSYGLGISAGKIRKFLAANHVKTDKAPAAENLSVEDIAARIEPVTVLIVTTY